MILNYIYFFEFYLVLNYCEDIGLQHLVLMDWVQSVENLQEMFEVKCRLSYFNFHKIGYTPKTKHQQIKQLPCQTIKKIEPYMEISYSFNRLNRKTYVLQDFQSIGQQQKVIPVYRAGEIWVEVLFWWSSLVYLAVLLSIYVSRKKFAKIKKIIVAL